MFPADVECVVVLCVFSKLNYILINHAHTDRDIQHLVFDIRLNLSVAELVH